MTDIQSIKLDVTDDLLDAITEAIAAQTIGPILFARRPSMGIANPVVLGGKSHLEAARIVARGVLYRLVQLGEKQP